MHHHYIACVFSPPGARNVFEVCGKPAFEGHSAQVGTASLRGGPLSLVEV